MQEVPLAGIVPVEDPSRLAVSSRIELGTNAAAEEVRVMLPCRRPYTITRCVTPAEVRSNASDVGTLKLSLANAVENVVRECPNRRNAGRTPSAGAAVSQKVQ